MDAMIRIKGSVLKSRLTFVEEHFGKDGLERVADSLPPDDRALVQGLLTTTGWYPFEVGSRLDRAIVQVLGGGNNQVFERLGEASAVKNLSTIHRQFLVEGDPHAFLAKAPSIYSFYYEGGQRGYEPTGPKEGILTTYDAETFSVPDCLTVVGWYRRALQMCGASAVRISEEECRAKGGKVCRYRVSWA
jgi:uncharacterized protein (TIGR02265 family)